MKALELIEQSLNGSLDEGDDNQTAKKANKLIDQGAEQMERGEKLMVMAASLLKRSKDKELKALGGELSDIIGEFNWEDSSEINADLDDYLDILSDK